MQKTPLRRGLDTLGHHLQIQLPGEIEDGQGAPASWILLSQVSDDAGVHLEVFRTRTPCSSFGSSPSSGEIFGLVGDMGQ